MHFSNDIEKEAFNENIAFPLILDNLFEDQARESKSNYFLILLITSIENYIKILTIDEMDKLEKPCTYHSALFNPSISFFVLECLGPGVPTTSLYTTSNYPELPALVTVLQNNTELKVSVLNKTELN